MERLRLGRPRTMSYEAAAAESPRTVRCGAVAAQSLTVVERRPPSLSHVGRRNCGASRVGTRTLTCECVLENQNGRAG